MASNLATPLPLPLSLLHRIFLALPADSRGRASCVARGWRDLLADPALWMLLDLSRESGISPRVALRGEALFRGAAGRAHGQLRELDTTAYPFTLATLLEVVTANAGSLRVLRVSEAYFGVVRFARRDEVPQPTVDALLAAAPLLEVLETDVKCALEDATRLLNSPGPLRVRKVVVLSTYIFRHEGGPVLKMTGSCDPARFGNFAAALADVALQPALSAVEITRAHSLRPAALDSLVNAVLARRLPKLSFRSCELPVAAPSIARLLLSKSLTKLEFCSTSKKINDDGVPLFYARHGPLVAGALRASTTLTTLVFKEAGLCSDKRGTRAAIVVLGALVGHPSLRTLVLSDEIVLKPEAVGSALATLVAADMPALQNLSIDGNSLGDGPLARLVYALRGNRHLRRLDISQNGLSEDFMLERLLPALRANTGMRTFWCGTSFAAAKEAEELVSSRGPVA
jgi:hypothetical protein